MSTINNRQIVLDTETTGMNKEGIIHQGHRIIEIGAVEIQNRRLTGNNFHVYLRPNRSIDLEAFKIHGISDEFLINKPTFNDVVENFINYIQGAELIIHNAAFDVNFINYELSLLDRNFSKIENICHIIDSLSIAKNMFPGKRNNLDALCIRYKIDNKKRILHSALLDADILSKVYLSMTGGQKLLPFDNHYQLNDKTFDDFNKNTNYPKNNNLRVILANNEEICSHELQLNLIMKKNKMCIWRN